MKRLYLIRHAKSSWKDASLQDSDRPLNERGKRDASFMGKRLQARRVMPDVLVTSPAKRARKTARMLAKELGYPKARIHEDAAIYDASVSTLMKIISGFDDDVRQVMLIGHNPGVTSVAETLTNTLLENIPTCGIVCVDFDGHSWHDVNAGTGTLVFFDYPKKHQ